MTATRPCCPTTHCQLPDFEIVFNSEVNQGDEPLWNRSSKGGTILRALLNRAFEEVETCTGSMADYSNMADILDNARDNKCLQ